MVALDYTDFEKNNGAFVPYDGTVQRVVAAIIAVITLAGVIINCLVLVAFARLKERMSSATLLLITLISFELTLNLTWFITNTVNAFSGGWAFGGNWMIFVYFIGSTTVPGILQLSIFLSLDRYYVIVKERPLSLSFFKQQVFGVIFGGIIMTFIPFYMGKWKVVIEVSNGMIHAVWAWWKPDARIFTCLVLVLVYGFFAFVIYIYYAIFRKVSKSADKMKEFSMKVSSTANKSAEGLTTTTVTPAVNTSASKNAAELERKTLLISIGIVSAAIIGWVPMTILCMIVPAINGAPADPITDAICVALVNIPFISDGLIILFFNKRIRSEIKTLFSKSKQ